MQEVENSSEEEDGAMTLNFSGFVSLTILVFIGLLVDVFANLRFL